MNLDYYLSELYKLEKKIEAYYINLAELEINGKETIEYNTSLVELNNLINEEKKYLVFLDKNFEIEEIIKKLNKDKQIEEPILIPLGFIPQCFHIRLLNIFEYINGDDLVSYAKTLKTDINKLILSLLNTIIQNKKYENMKESLIFYKYSLYFMDYDLESKLLLGEESKSITLNARDYRTSSMPSYIYVDKTMLVLESNEFLNILQIPNIENNLTTEIVISTLNLISRLILCEDNTLKMIYPEFLALLESDLTNKQIKELIYELIEALKTLQNNLNWSDNLTK